MDYISLEDTLYKYLERDLADVVKLYSSRYSDFFIDIPAPDDIDAHKDDIAVLIAKTSNAYAKACYLAGRARAQMKLAKARYDRQYKKARTGKNEAEREQAGMVAAEQEHCALATIEAIVEMASSLEDATRVASESARKLYVAKTMIISAESSGLGVQVSDKNFESW